MVKRQSNHMSICSNIRRPSPYSQSQLKLFNRKRKLETIYQPLSASYSKRTYGFIF